MEVWLWAFIGDFMAHGFYRFDTDIILKSLS